jgi:hypothetical protein
MDRFFRRIFTAFILLALFQACNKRKTDFSSQVKPILNKHCITCHGGVKQNGGFSVLFREEALDTTESGKYAIVPGHPEESELIRRITSHDPEYRMPYKEEPLSSDEIGILTNWVKEGAQWEEHWAYIPPRPVEVPKSEQLLSGVEPPSADWAKNDIDYFVVQKLAEHQLKPSPEAARAILIRRVYLDIIGIPPTPEQARKFIDDTRPDAYERIVDELLASPHYGEKWASWWLDLARYADTKGYEADPSRVIWRFRDYVIRSFNEDKPFDQFTIEQLAGDMLPDPTDEQMIATAFHRNTMNNDEGGTDDEEFRTAAIMDRVATTWEVFQGTTMSCVQCHSHPYDPIHHEEYYKAFAYFNNTRDEDVSSEHPLLRTYSKEDEEKLKAIRTWVLEHADKDKATETMRFLKTLEPKYHAHIFDRFINGELNGYKWLSVRPEGSARMKHMNISGKTHLFINYSARKPGGSFEIRTDTLAGDIVAHVDLKKTDSPRIIDIPIPSVEGVHDLYFQFHNPALDKSESVCTIEWFAFRGDLPGRGDARFPAEQALFLKLLNANVDETPVLVESNEEQWRETRVFERGNWLVKGERVQPGIPRSLATATARVPSDRLEFARWLVSKDNPLTARTMVNRIWDQIFGKGIVETLEDFGSQGAPPTHPELLDWLALRFMDDDRWSMKKLISDIVLSATYRQSSRVTDEMLEKDARNEWLGRGARLRLSAEQVRDQALAVSGLLSDKMYGQSVMPFQPEGIWNSVYNNSRWVLSDGENRHRRGVYTYVKRTSPYPSMMMFDGSSREVCLGKRIRTNTPLQALVTLNDPVFVEAARAFANRMMMSDSSCDNRIRNGYRFLTFCDLPDPKLKIFRSLYDDALQTYRADSAAVHALTSRKNANEDLAAMTVVANALLNLDEVIMKE